ncbi:MAG: radical SAM protein [Lentisphaerae bacterium]|nr:radical SAM protein [Lentisphaerota bacterium]
MSAQSYVVKRELTSSPFWRRASLVPERLDIELTERCNNACIHCNINLSADDARAKTRELKTIEWKRILRQAADLGIITVRFTGGEPLLREDFAELYLFARRLGLAVLIFTNGRLITPQLADLLSRIPPREALEISVYGLRPESCEAVTRSPGAHAEFRRGIALLLERKIPFILKGALLPPNKQEMPELAAWAEAMPGMAGLPFVAAKFFDLRKRRDTEVKNRQIAGLRVTPEEGLAIITRQPERYCREMAGFCRKFTGPRGAKLFACGAGHSGCVDAYGRFHACLPLRYPDLAYDLKNGSIREALKVVLSRVRGMRAANPEYLERCARCFLQGLCEQCPAKSWSEHGALDRPVEYLCQVAHAQAGHLGLLAAGEKAWKVKDWQARIRRLKEEGA